MACPFQNSPKGVPETARVNLPDVYCANWRSELMGGEARPLDQESMYG